MMRNIVVPLAFCSIAFCDTETKVKLKDLPEPVQKAVQEQTKNAKLKGLSKEVEKGATFYEVETSVNGKTRDVLLDTSGNVVEVEEAVAFSSLPPAVQKTLTASAGAGKILSVESVTKGSVVSYEAVIRKDGKKSEVAVNADGTLPKKE
jgi:uncharacterized membrane protein YkoI